MDFILNGQASGDVASVLMANNFNPRALRPYIGDDNRSYIDTVQNGKIIPMLTNATASLRKDDWKIMDDAVIKVAKPRLRAVADLLGLGLRYNIPNGMGKTVLETETISDVSEAIISMDGLRQSNTDRPVFELNTLPLPIIHKDVDFSARQVQTSRNGGSPIDTSTAEAAGRRVAEQAEGLLLGTSTAYAYAGGTIPGYKTFTSRMTKVITSPEASGWTGNTLVQETLAMRLQSQNAHHYGPWMCYVGPSWDVYLDDDYSTAKGDNTLRDRLKKINGIQDVRTVDSLVGYEILLVQMTSDVVREVMGMDITTVQWATQGGMQLNFKVMAIMVPQLRADQNGNTGIVHGSVAE